MALVKCKECKHEISKKAKKCPNCGAPIKRTSVVTWLVGIIFSMLVIGMVSNGARAPTKYTSTAVKKQADPLSLAKTRAKLANKHIKKAQRNPKSYVLEKVFYAEKTKALCFDYRSQNGFGGINKIQAVLIEKSGRIVTSEDDGFVSVYNEQCAKEGYDITYAVK